MATISRELRDPWALGLAVLTTVASFALRVTPLKAVGAGLLVLAVKVGAELLWPRVAPAVKDTPAPSSPRGKLSPRELEVALLIPTGLSNKQIARKLVPPTSERTVDNHIQHIFNKLGFDSREQIAAWVATRYPTTP